MHYTDYQITALLFNFNAVGEPDLSLLFSRLATLFCKLHYAQYLLYTLSRITFIIKCLKSESSQIVC